MLNASIVFFVIAIVAYVLGAFGVVGLSLEIGKTLLVVFLVLSVTGFIVSMLRGKSSHV